MNRPSIQIAILSLAATWNLAGCRGMIFESRAKTLEAIGQSLLQRAESQQLRDVSGSVADLPLLADEERATLTRLKFDRYKISREQKDTFGLQLHSPSGATFGTSRTRGVPYSKLHLIPSTDLRSDIELMWETERHVAGVIGSSEKAIAAAERVFNTVELRGLTKQGVLALLGDPAIRNKTNYAPKTYPPERQLVYYFDTGNHGMGIDIHFNRSGRVNRVRRHYVE
jgi:hypothetical protein